MIPSFRSETLEHENTPDLNYDHRIESTQLSSNGSCSGCSPEVHTQGFRHQYSILSLLVAALKKSLVVTCSVVEANDDASIIEISQPMNVRHVSHVTFDCFEGFLGLPIEFQPQLPDRVPSASASVFGVSPKSMHCSCDQRGNDVPTILLMMQNQLYAAKGLQTEGIFRITGESSKEKYVRSQLNRGILPSDIDVHCISGLIKGWFRELPRGILDSIPPEKMHSDSEEDILRLLNSIPPCESSLLDWAINLMADVVEHQHQNKMNARNIAMVFAPNMTQMSDPLVALFHAVEVMKLLEALILKTLRERNL